MRSLPSALPFVMTIWHACVPQCWNVSWKVCGAPAWRVYCFGPKAGVMSAKPAGGNITATNANASTSTIILPDIFLSFCLQLPSSLLGPSGRGGTTSGPTPHDQCRRVSQKNPHRAGLEIRDMLRPHGSGVKLSRRAGMSERTIFRLGTETSRRCAPPHRPDVALHPIHTYGDAVDQRK